MAPSIASRRGTLPGIETGSYALRGIVSTAEDEPFENLQVINNGTVSVHDAAIGAANAALGRIVRSHVRIEP